MSKLYLCRVVTTLNFQLTASDDVSIQNSDVEFDNVNDQFNDFYFKLEGCTIKKINPKETKLMSKPWISNELIKMINVRNKLFRRKKRQPNNISIKNLYKLFWNRINREMKKFKRDHYNQFFENNNIKKTWGGIRSIINTKDSNISNIIQLKINKTIINNHKKIVEEVNNYFVNVGPNTERSIPRNPVTKPNIYLKNRNQVNFLIVHISNDEVLVPSLKHLRINPQDHKVSQLNFWN